MAISAPSCETAAAPPNLSPAAPSLALSLADCVRSELPQSTVGNPQLKADGVEDGAEKA